MLEDDRSTRADASPNDRLLRAARDVLAKRGFQAEITEVITRAGISNATLYRAYPSKEALFLEIAREMANRTSAKLLKVVATVPDARECVARIMEVGFGCVKEYGQLAVELVAGVVPAAYSAVVNRETLRNFFVIVIQRGILQGSFRPDLDVEYAAEAWLALVAPQALRSQSGRRSVDEIAALTTDFFLAAIEIRSAEPDRSDS